MNGMYLLAVIPVMPVIHLGTCSRYTRPATAVNLKGLMAPGETARLFAGSKPDPVGEPHVRSRLPGAWFPWDEWHGSGAVGKQFERQLVVGQHKMHPSRIHWAACVGSIRPLTTQSPAFFFLRKTK